MDETLAERVESVLYEHRMGALTCYDHGGYCCVCGVHDVMGYRLHLAQVLAAFVAAQRAEALRDAVDGWPREINRETLRREAAASLRETPEPYTAANWLRARADEARP